MFLLNWAPDLGQVHAARLRDGRAEGRPALPDQGGAQGHEGRPSGGGGRGKRVGVRERVGFRIRRTVAAGTYFCFSLLLE